MGIERKFNLARHPIAALDNGSGAALVEGCRSRLRARGAYVLEGFLRQEAVAAILGELDGVLENAYYKPKTHNPYLARLQRKRYLHRHQWSEPRYRQRAG